MESGKRKAKSREWVQAQHRIIKPKHMGLAACMYLTISAIILFFVENSAWAEDDSAELGHHWDVPAYTGEIRIQLVAMAVITIILVLAMRFAALRKRKAEQR